METIRILIINREIISEICFLFVWQIYISLYLYSRNIHVTFHIEIIHLVRMQNFPKKNNIYPLIRARICAYQWVRNFSFFRKFCVRTEGVFQYQPIRLKVRH